MEDLQGFSPNLAEDFVVISRAEFERIFGAEIQHFGSVQGSPGMLM